MVCERCGHEITGNSSNMLCPICGTAIGKQTSAQSLSSYMRAFQNSARERSLPPHGEFPRSQRTSQPHEQLSKDGSKYVSRLFHAANAINVPPMESFSSARSYENVLTIEFILSLLGIFGIGWLLAGETIVGILLLTGSIVIYWPLMIWGTLVTFGFGLICLGPLAVTCVMCNALLLNLCLKRKMARRR